MWEEGPSHTLPMSLAYVHVDTSTGIVDTHFVYYHVVISTCNRHSLQKKRIQLFDNACRGEASCSCSYISVYRVDTYVLSMHSRHSCTSQRVYGYVERFRSQTGIEISHCLPSFTNSKYSAPCTHHVLSLHLDPYFALTHLINSSLRVVQSKKLSYRLLAQAVRQSSTTMMSQHSHCYQGCIQTLAL